MDPSGLSTTHVCGLDRTDRRSALFWSSFFADAKKDRFEPEASAFHVMKVRH